MEIGRRDEPGLIVVDLDSGLVDKDGLDEGCNVDLDCKDDRIVGRNVDPDLIDEFGLVVDRGVNPGLSDDPILTVVWNPGLTDEPLDLIVGCVVKKCLFDDPGITVGCDVDPAGLPEEPGLIDGCNEDLGCADEPGLTVNIVVYIGFSDGFTDGCNVELGRIDELGLNGGSDVDPCLKDEAGPIDVGVLNPGLFDDTGLTVGCNVVPVLIDEPGIIVGCNVDPLGAVVDSDRIDGAGLLDVVSEINLKMC